ncbi:hypothetical protein ACLOJK_026717, partial [Asimina triloba]
VFDGNTATRSLRNGDDVCNGSSAHCQSTTPTPVPAAGPKECQSSCCLGGVPAWVWVLMLVRIVATRNRPHVGCWDGTRMVMVRSPGAFVGSALDAAEDQPDLDDLLVPRWVLGIPFLLAFGGYDDFRWKVAVHRLIDVGGPPMNGMDLDAMGMDLASP